MKRGFTLIELLIVVAIIAILAAIAVPNFLEAQTRSRVSRVNADERSLQLAIEAYYVDCTSYPAQASSFPSMTAFGVNDIDNAPLTASVSCRYMPTFRHKSSASDNLYTLTTPIQYMTSFTTDPFATSKGAIYNFSKAGTYGQTWILWSYGPDMDERTQQVPPTTTPPVVCVTGAGGDIIVNPGTMDGAPGIETIYYSPNFTVPSGNLIMATYDPTNGTNSSGDVYKYKN